MSVLASVRQKQKCDWGQPCRKNRKLGGGQLTSDSDTVLVVRNDTLLLKDLVAVQSSSSCLSERGMKEHEKGKEGEGGGTNSWGPAPCRTIGNRPSRLRNESERARSWSSLVKIAPPILKSARKGGLEGEWGRRQVYEGAPSVLSQGRRKGGPASEERRLALFFRIAKDRRTYLRTANLAWGRTPWLDPVPVLEVKILRYRSTSFLVPSE